MRPIDVSPTDVPGGAGVLPAGSLPAGPGSTSVNALQGCSSPASSAMPGLGDQLLHGVELFVWLGVHMPEDLVDVDRLQLVEIIYYLRDGSGQRYALACRWLGGDGAVDAYHHWQRGGI